MSTIAIPVGIVIILIPDSRLPTPDSRLPTPFAINPNSYNFSGRIIVSGTLLYHPHFLS
ncbi:hypothetical protein [Moorena producens]|uniref:hypothetical protein n=1 Tax=Moorena producens TaxID=1155739 RepID=UPI0013146AB3|nr:hypothetical protein [Moorena producens]